MVGGRLTAEKKGCSEMAEEVKAVKPTNLQDNFLNQARKDNSLVTVHLMNGFQIKGFVRGFDNFTVIIDSMGRQQLIYKHAISTITPGSVAPSAKRVPKSAAEEDA